MAYTDVQNGLYVVRIGADRTRTILEALISGYHGERVIACKDERKADELCKKVSDLETALVHGHEIAPRANDLRISWNDCVLVPYS